MISKLKLIVAPVVSILACGCGGGGTSLNLPLVSDTYLGVFSGPGDASGTLTVSIATDASTGATLGVLPAALTAMATLNPTEGSPVGLSGTFDDVTLELVLSGEGFTLSGALLEQTVLGSLEGPDGDGRFAAVRADAGTVKRYCGSWESLIDQDRGLINLAVNSTVGVVAIAFSEFEDGVSFSTFEPTDGTRFDAGLENTAGERLLVGGELFDVSAQGLWQFDVFSDPDEGSWNASTLACSI